MGSINLLLARAFEFLIGFIPAKALSLENGVRLFRLSRDEWLYSDASVSIRFTTDIQSGPIDFMLFEGSMRYGPDFEAEVGLEKRKEVAQAFVSYMKTKRMRVQVV